MLERALERLDAEQRAVAAWRPNDGNLRIESEAGSGKTTVLTALIASLLTEGHVDPAQLILGTFGNKAARLLIQRLLLLIQPHLMPDRIGTFHALALRRLRKPSRIALPPHRWNMAQCLDAEGRTRNANIPTNHILWRCATEFGKMPGTEKPSLRCAATAEEVQQYARFADLCRSRMVKTGGEYHELMGVRPPKDFDEAWALVNESKSILRAWDFTDALEGYLHALQTDPHFDSAALITVDEAQDNNALMMQVVEQLAKNHMEAGNDAEGRIVLIGNGSQAIHAWMGAAPEIFATADKRFGAKTLFLKNNYRSVEEIVALGNQITDGKDWKLGPSAVSARGKSKGSEPVIQVLYALPDAMETVADNVVGEIVHAIQVQDARPDDFAILTRTNAALTQYQAALATNNIPHVLIGKESLFAAREIETFIAWCVMAEHATFGALENAVRHPNRFLGKAFVGQVEEVMAAGETSILKAIEAVGDQRGGASQNNAYKLAEDIRRLHALPWDNIPDAVLAMLLPTTEKKTKIRAGDSPDEDQPGLFKAACAVFKRFPSSLDACDFVDRVSSMATSERDDGDSPGGRVTLTTAHRSKGREWKHVYIDCSSGSFPSSKSTSRELEDERRLFNVAVTRAADRLTIVCADQPSEFALRYIGAERFKQAGWVKGQGGEKAAKGSKRGEH